MHAESFVTALGSGKSSAKDFLIGIRDYRRGACQLIVERAAAATLHGGSKPSLVSWEPVREHCSRNRLGGACPPGGGQLGRVMVH